MRGTDATNVITREELDQQSVVALPARDLMLAVTVFGIPVVGLTGVNINIG